MDMTDSPLIHTSADLRLWLDGYDSGATAVLRILAQVPPEAVPGVVEHLLAEVGEGTPQDQ